LLVDGKQYYTVAGTDRVRGFTATDQNLIKTTLLQNAFALLDMGTRTHEADRRLYVFLLEWIEFIETIPSVSAERSAFLLSSFLLKFLSYQGYCPELQACFVCEKNIQAGGYMWHALKGGVICGSCVQKDKEQWFAARPLADVVLKLMRYALRESFPDQLRLRLSGEVLPVFHEALESFIVAHFPVIPAVSLRESCRHLS